MINEHVQCFYDVNTESYQHCK